MKAFPYKNLLLLTSLLLCHYTAAQPCFPCAVGFGTDTPAGKGGNILGVTSLDSKGPGSLREALSAKGPRIVVFEIAGVIDLEKKSISITEPFLTVAGQTAPSPGITIIRGGISISTHDVLIQHLRVRPGDAGEPKKSGWSPDGISTSGGNAHHIVIDHCSITWAVDENLTASGPQYEGQEATSRKITFSHCIVAEGLNDSSHEKGPHSKGSLIHDHCTEIAIIGNLYAHNDRRNPYFKAYTTGVIVNNLIYNPGNAAIQVGFYPPEWVNRPTPKPPRLSIVGNVMMQGKDTLKPLPLVSHMAEAYMEDNLVFQKDGSPGRLTGGKIDLLKKKPLWPEGLVPIKAKRLLATLAPTVGARPKDRDAVDDRIIQQLLSGEGQIIDSQSQVGGYPEVEPIKRKLDIADDVQSWLARLAKEVEGDE